MIRDFFLREIEIIYKMCVWVLSYSLLITIDFSLKFRPTILYSNLVNVHMNWKLALLYNTQKYFFLWWNFYVSPTGKNATRKNTGGQIGCTKLWIKGWCIKRAQTKNFCVNKKSTIFLQSLRNLLKITTSCVGNFAWISA